MFGVGGGILFVPTLVLGLGLTQVHAGASSLLAILPTALVGTWRLQRQGNVDAESGRNRSASRRSSGVQGGVLAAEALPGVRDPAALRDPAPDHGRAARPARPDGRRRTPWQNRRAVRQPPRSCCSCSQSLPAAPPCAAARVGRRGAGARLGPTTGGFAWAIRITIPGQTADRNVDRLRLGHLERRRVHLPRRRVARHGRNDDRVGDDVGRSALPSPKAESGVTGLSLFGARSPPTGHRPRVGRHRLLGRGRQSTRQQPSPISSRSASR